MLKGIAPLIIASLVAGGVVFDANEPEDKREPGGPVFRVDVTADGWKLGFGVKLFDMAGNVWEWVWDVYQSNYEALPSIDPFGPSTGANRVIRGASWTNSATDTRIAIRNAYMPTFRSTSLGFRIVRSGP